MKAEDVFLIRQTNEEGNDFIITVGKHLATEKHFATPEEAEEYIKTPHWDTTIAMVAEMFTIHEENKHNNTEK